jgi:hypothetical protein
MVPFAFSAFGTLAGLAVAAFVGNRYRRWFRRIPSLETFTPGEQRILTYQLAALSLWSLAALAIFIFSVWSDAAFDILAAPPVSLILGALNLTLIGFVAITSLARQVTILSALRIGQQPSRGRTAFVYGLLLLALIAYATWKMLSPAP